MKPTDEYTCTAYRQEMILLSLMRQLEDPALPEMEKARLAGAVDDLKRQLGMD